MKELIVCKVCGFVMDKTGLAEKCPACGVPAKMFEPYADKLSPARRLLLKLDLHPIFAHFPQAFSFTLLVLSAASMIFEEPLRQRVSAAIPVIGVLLPFTVLLTFLAGLLDGKTRLRRLATPLLVKKMVFGVLFLLFSVGILILVQMRPVETSGPGTALLVMETGAFGCSAVLGFLGTSLLNSQIPG